MSNYQFQVKRFNFISRPSPWQQMQRQHARMAKVSADFQSASTAASSTMFAALTDQVSGLASNAAQAALTRIQAETKAKSDASLKQIDDVQSLVDKTKAAVASTSTNSSTTASTGTLLDAVA